MSYANDCAICVDESNYRRCVLDSIEIDS